MPGPWCYEPAVLPTASRSNTGRPAGCLPLPLPAWSSCDVYPTTTPAKARRTRQRFRGHLTSPLRSFPLPGPLLGCPAECLATHVLAPDLCNAYMNPPCSSSLSGTSLVLYLPRPLPCLPGYHRLDVLSARRLSYSNYISFKYPGEGMCLLSFGFFSPGGVV